MNMCMPNNGAGTAVHALLHQVQESTSADIVWQSMETRHARLIVRVSLDWSFVVSVPCGSMMTMVVVQMV